MKTLLIKRKPVDVVYFLVTFKDEVVAVGFARSRTCLVCNVGLNAFIAHLS